MTILITLSLLFTLSCNAGVIHHWSLDESVGQVRADSVGTNHLTEAFECVPTGCGVTNGAASCLGSFTESLQTEPMDFAPPFTVQFWFRLSSYSTGTILDRSSLDTGIPDFEIRLQHVGGTNKSITCLASEEGTMLIFGLPTLGDWHQLTFTVNADFTTSGSIDGGPSLSGDWVEYPGDWRGRLLLGNNNYWGTGGFDGLMDELTISTP